MSYILDALKKSEQERGHGDIPSVQTVHTSSLNYHNKKAVWPYVLITAVLLNLAAIVFFYLDTDTTSVATDTASVTAGSDADRTAAAPPVEATLQEYADPEPQAMLADKTISATPMATTIDDSTDDYQQSAATENHAVQSDFSKIIDYHELPASIKQQLPTITVSAHVYSSNPLQRSIVINNNFLEEGEYVLDDLILQEITADGAILFYRGTQFHYGVVSGWQ